MGQFGSKLSGEAGTQLLHSCLQGDSAAANKVSCSLCITAGRGHV